MASQISQQPLQSRPETNNNGTSSSMLGEEDPQIAHSDLTSYVTTLQPSNLDMATNSAPYKVTNLIDSDHHSIVSFLGRPQLLGTKTWSSNDVRGTIIATFPMTFFFTATVKDKVKGLGYFRGNPVLRLQVNLPPTTAGMLALAWIPGNNSIQYQQIKNLNGLDKDISLSQMSTLNLVKMNINVEQDVTFKVPYVYSKPFVDLTTVRDCDFGTFVLFVVSPLEGGPTSANVAVWSHFEDVLLAGPTSKQLMTSEPEFHVQMGKTYYKQDNLTVIDDDEDEEEAPALHNSEPTLEQTPTISERFSGLKEHGSKVLGIGEVQNGVISGLTKVAANISFAASAIFPPISWLTLPAAGIFSGVSRIAKIFGYGRKVNMFKSKPVFTRNLEGFANTDGLDDSHPLAIYADTDLMPKELFGTDVDEMNINYIASHPFLLNHFTYSTESDPGTLLYTLDLRLAQWYTALANTTPGNSAYEIFSPILYAAAPFNFWRGERILHLTFVKNRFQAGRVMVVFEPFDGAESDWLMSDYTYKIILDLKDKCEFAITIPFLTNQEWFSLGDFPGVIRIFALDNLIVGGGTSTQVDVLVEVAAAPTFEVAVLSNIYQYPFLNTAKISTNGTDPGPFGEIGTRPTFQAQSSDTINFLKRQLEPLSFFPGHVPPSSHPNETNISIRPILHRYYPVNSTIMYDALCNNLSPVNMVSYLSYFSALFAWWRGSFRVKIAPNVDTSNVNAFLGIGFQGSFLAGYEHINTKGSVAVTVPYYNRYLLAPTDCNGDYSYTRFLEFTSNIPNLKATDLHCALAAGEDFQCGCWCGVPIVYSNDVYNTTSPDPKYGPGRLFDKVTLT